MEQQGEKKISLRWHYLYLGIMVISLLIFLGTTTSWSQTPTPTDNEELRRRNLQEEIERKEREKAKDVFLQSSEKADEDTSLPVEEPAFLISSLQLEGEKVEKFSWVQRYLDKYAGRVMGKEGINIIIKRLTNQLIERGYVTTRIAIPEQDLSQGNLKLILIPGLIREIYLADGGPDYNWRGAFPVRAGDILNIRDLEQGLEQMKRVPSQDVDMQIVPGEKLGESDVIITVKRDKNWRLSLSLDNAGSKPTGKLQASTTLSLDNLLGINDIFYVTLNSDADANGEMKGTRGHNIYYSFPYGYWTFALIKERYKYHQTVQGISQKFIYSGEGDTEELRIQRLLQRDQTSKTNLQFRLIKKHSKSFIDDTEIEVQKKNLTAVEVALIKRQYRGKAIIDWDLAYKRGVPWFGAQPDIERTSPDLPTTRYSIWTLDGSITTPVMLGSKQGRYSFNFRAQTTKNVLYAADFFSIGNRYTVRGFDGEQTLAAEKGWLVRNELAVPFSPGQEIYLGIDHGEVGGPSSKWLIGKSLTGGALGMRGGDNRFYYDFFVSCPLDKPKGYRTAKNYLGFQLSCQY